MSDNCGCCCCQDRCYQALDRIVGNMPDESDPLSERQKQVIAMVADGFENIEIGKQLGIAPNTVKQHIAHAMKKLGCANRTQVAVLAVRRRLIV